MILNRGNRFLYIKYSGHYGVGNVKSKLFMAVHKFLNVTQHGGIFLFGFLPFVGRHDYLTWITPKELCCFLHILGRIIQITM